MSQPIAEFTDYDGLRRALNAVREGHRDMSFELLDEITGAPKGFFSKILGPRQQKRIGMQSLGWALGGLGVKAVLVEDPAALALIKARLKKRDTGHLAAVRNGAVHVQLNRGFLRKIGAKGGANSRKNLTKRERRKLAQAAARARWGKLKRRKAKRLSKMASESGGENHGASQ